MARVTLVFGSFIGTASLPEIICKEKLPITIPIEYKPVIYESITQEVIIDTPTIPLNLISSHVAVQPKSGELITFEKIAQELYRVVLLNPLGYHDLTGLPTSYPFYDYVYLSLWNSIGHRLMSISNRAEQAHPAIN